MPTYTMLSGHELHYELTPEVEPFYERVLSASRDPEVSGARLLELVYSRDNPLLEEGPFGPQVTRAVLEKPLYALFQDLIFRKEVKESGGSVEEDFARDDRGAGASETENRPKERREDDS